MTHFLIEQAKDWLLDCGCPKEELVDRSSGEIIAEVDKQYVGGWAQFLVDIEALEEWHDHSKTNLRNGLVQVVQKSNFGNTRTRLRTG